MAFFPENWREKHAPACAPFDAGRSGNLAASGSARSEAEPSLGTTAKSVDQISPSWSVALAAVSEKASECRKARRALARVTASRRSLRARRFKLQRMAAKLMAGKGRVGLCRWSVKSKEDGVDLVRSRYSTGEMRAHFLGTQTCGSVWLCPCCGARISETRRRELNALLAWARAEGLQPVMVTLTARHGIRDDLQEQLDAMKRAKQRLRQRREWRRLKTRIAGTVTATEVTHGANGWHTHFHEILLIEADDEAAALALLRGLDRVWRACLLGVGLSGGRAAWQAQGAAAAGRYVGKWGAAEELTLGDAKSGRGAGRTPMQLLSDAEGGDAKAGALWRTYADAFSGRRQLVWSPGLKDRAQIDDTTDVAAANDERQDDQEEVDRTNIEHQAWREVAKTGADRRAELLDTAEKIGPEAAVSEVLDEDLEIVEKAVYQPRPGQLVEKLREIMEKRRKQLEVPKPPDSCLSPA